MHVTAQPSRCKCSMTSSHGFFRQCFRSRHPPDRTAQRSLLSRDVDDTNLDVEVACNNSPNKRLSVEILWTPAMSVASSLHSRQNIGAGTLAIKASSTRTAVHWSAVQLLWTSQNATGKSKVVEPVAYPFLWFTFHGHPRILFLE